MLDRIKKHSSISLSMRYFLISCSVTIADTVIVYATHYLLGWQVVFSNTAGVIAGSLFHYLMANKYVFKNAKGFIWALQYTAVFLMGLFLANFIIWFIYEKLGIILLIAKVFSIVIPYFFMLHTRKYLYEKKFTKN